MTVFASPGLARKRLLPYAPRALWALLAPCKTLGNKACAARRRADVKTQQRITKNQNLRHPEQPRVPRLGFGRERRARQDVLLDQPSKGVALAQFGVQRHGDLAQGLAEGPIT